MQRPRRSHAPQFRILSPATALNWDDRSPFKQPAPWQCVISVDLRGLIALLLTMALWVYVFHSALMAAG